MSDALRARIRTQLAEHHVASLATVGADGPWASSVFYAWDENFALYFLSAPDSRHGRNVGAGATVAASINADYADWPEIRGLQLDGQCELLAPEAEAPVRALYAQRFPIAGMAGKAPAAIVRALAKVRWYALRPRAITLIDNRLGFGQRETLTLTT